MNVSDYLQRLNVAEEPRLDWQYLSVLQARHMLTIPFENLDIMEGREIELDVNAFFNKMVVQQRGGFCYELNGLLYWLLRELGFDVFMLSGRVMRAEGGYGPEFDHMALLVRLGQDYLVDVGFGDSVRSPLPFSGDEVHDVSGTYRLQKGSLGESEYFFQKVIEGQWVSEFKFTTIPRELNEFTGMCRYQQTSPESHFTHRPIVSIATDDGRITLSGNQLTVTAGEEKKKLTIASPEQRREILRDYFGIS